MLLMFHLWIGTVIGASLSGRTREWLVMTVCCIFALLPDLIDKPLVILAPTICTGRYLAHTILFAIICILLSNLALSRKPWVIGCACGIFGHQLLDQMWATPANWLFPFLGSFPTAIYKDYLSWGLIKELFTPSEWFFGLATVLMLYSFYSSTKRESLVMTVGVGVPALILCGFGF